MRKPRQARGRNLDLFDDQGPRYLPDSGFSWPSGQSFPINVTARTVRNTVVKDLLDADAPLVVAGYTSLDEVIDLAARCRADASIRVLFGNEPFPGRRDRYRPGGGRFAEEIERYWLDRGISLRRSAGLIECIEALESRRVEARCLSEPGRRLHGKIYVTEKVVTLGSSNFTRAGLEGNLEANARFTREREPERYGEAVEIAENYWKMASDFSEELIALLHSLLRFVEWREALARACAELLEGEWADDYIVPALLPEEVNLWPSQRQGIAQALYVLSRQGSVLVADATGSGKTRLGAHLIRAVQDQITVSGRLRRGRATMVCPPSVEDNWNAESRLVDTSIETVSHGRLSRATAGRHEDLADTLRRAQILCVDEGHNFFNLAANRTRGLLRNMADHVLIFTATPINRGVVDLLRIVDLLGADNMEQDALDAFKRLLGVQNISRSLTEDELKKLRAEIQKFTVRRTKGTLNELIRRDPGAYVDHAGSPCRFPRHDSRLYPLNESAADRKIAKRIRELADKLHAVMHFTGELALPLYYRNQGLTADAYLQRRLRMAGRIARYQVMALLRSSRAALVEHIAGTAQAVQDFDLEGFKKSTQTGNLLRRLRDRRGRPPKSRLETALPDWLEDAEAHAAACDHDISIYSRIYECIGSLSDARDAAKVAKLIELAEKHSLVLAFDRSPITLHALRQRIERERPDRKTIIATGDAGSDRERVLDAFRPGSGARNMIGLCSDSLSEGVNLQQASCMVHLDMPSVVRIAEQRAGRVDRMDSPHAVIEAWWPKDAREFALTSDEKFIERYQTVDTLLGSNMPLPEGMRKKAASAISARELVKAYDEKAGEEPWDGIRDAFEPVRGLIGKDQLVDQSTYDHYRKVKARVLSRVSLIRSGGGWAFFCLKGGSFGAPRWILFPDRGSEPVSELGAISRFLRRRLGPEVESRQMDAAAARLCEKFVDRLGATERALLPRKKQRALEEMEAVLERYVVQASGRRDQDRVERYRAIAKMLRADSMQHQPDWNQVAALWLDLIRPIWYEKLKHPRRKPLLLRDIRRDLVEKEESLGQQIVEAFVEFPVLPAPDERISAAIVGVPG